MLAIKTTLVGLEDDGVFPEDQFSRRPSAHGYRGKRGSDITFAVRISLILPSIWQAMFGTILAKCANMEEAVSIDACSQGASISFD